MKRSRQAIDTFWSDLLRALLLACLVFQGVIGSAHLAFAAAAADDAAPWFVCSANGSTDIPADDETGDPKQNAKRACAGCASNQQAGGASLPNAAPTPVPSTLAPWRIIAIGDQWPQARQPASVNSRSPPLLTV
jgi:hypothetical protein